MLVLFAFCHIVVIRSFHLIIKFLKNGKPNHEKTLKKIDGHPTEYLTRMFQSCQCHDKQGKSEILSQTVGTKKLDG